MSVIGKMTKTRAAIPMKMTTKVKQSKKVYKRKSKNAKDSSLRYGA